MKYSFNVSAFTSWGQQTGNKWCILTIPIRSRRHGQKVEIKELLAFWWRKTTSKRGRGCVWEHTALGLFGLTKHGKSRDKCWHQHLLRWALFSPSLGLSSFAFCLFLNSLILFFVANSSLRLPSPFCFSLFSLNCLCLPYPHFIHIPPSDRNDRSCLVLNESDVMKKISLPVLTIHCSTKPIHKTATIKQAH